MLFRSRLATATDGSTTLTGVCRGTIVSRCDGSITLYGEAAVIRAAAGRADNRVVVGVLKFASPAGAKLKTSTRLTPIGKKLLQRHGAVRVNPIVSMAGDTKIERDLPPFVLSIMTPAEWLKKALATLYVGGAPRMDLNNLLDDARNRRIDWKVAANRIEKQIIPDRERARAKVDALPIPPPRLKPIATLLERAFDQSLAANHAYVAWLRSGNAEDTQGWRLSLRASATKAQLMAAFAKAAAPYGIRVPAPTNFWP